MEGQLCKFCERETKRYLGHCPLCGEADLEEIQRLVDNQQELFVLRGIVDEVVMLATSCLPLASHSDAHKLAERIVRRCFSSRPPRSRPQWRSHKWEDRLYDEFIIEEEAVLR